MSSSNPTMPRSAASITIPAEPPPAKDDLPVIFGQRLEPWVNLANRFGLPWTLIALGLFYVIPWAAAVKDSVVKMQKSGDETTSKLGDVYRGLNSLEAQATKAMPLLEESSKSVQLLRDIHEATRAGTQQRHADLRELKEEMKPLAKPKAD